MNVYRASLNPIVLVLDGHYLIEATAVDHTLSLLIDYQPTPLYLIIAVRRSAAATRTGGLDRELQLAAMSPREQWLLVAGQPQSESDGC